MTLTADCMEFLHAVFVAHNAFQFQRMSEKNAYTTGNSLAGWILSVGFVTYSSFPFNLLYNNDIVAQIQFCLNEYYL